MSLSLPLALWDVLWPFGRIHIVWLNTSVPRLFNLLVVYVGSDRTPFLVDTRALDSFDWARSVFVACPTYMKECGEVEVPTEHSPLERCYWLRRIEGVDHSLNLWKKRMLQVRSSCSIRWKWISLSSIWSGNWDVSEEACWWEVEILIPIFEFDLKEESRFWLHSSERWSERSSVAFLKITRVDRCDQRIPFGVQSGICSLKRGTW